MFESRARFDGVGLLSRWLCAFAALLCLGIGGAAFGQTVLSPSIAQVYGPGSIYAVQGMPDGRVIIGGLFGYVNGVARKNIARINADGSLDATWDPGADGTVRALAVDPSTGVVYVGGDFTNIGGATRNFVAKLSLSTGTADPSWNPGASATVRSLSLDPPGGAVYIAGDFATLASTAQPFVGRVSNTSGAIDPTWNPSPNAPVHFVRFFGAGVYVGGAFTMLGAQTRNYLARIPGAGSGAPDSWDPNATGTVRAMVVNTPGDVFVGGDFSSIGGQSRGGLAKVLSSGSVDTNWNPGTASFGVYALDIDANDVYVGGAFTQIGSTPQAKNHLAKISQSSPATLSTWDPGIAGPAVHAIFMHQSKVLVGGTFASAAGQVRGGIAQVDPASAASTAAWPVTLGLDCGFVAAISRDATGRVVIGGNFIAMGDRTTYRLNLARFNADGTLDTAWDPTPDDEVFALAHDASGNVFAGGYFKKIGGALRTSIAKLSASGTGLADATFNASIVGSPYGQVYALAHDGAGNLYAAGYFTGIGGQTRNNIAKLSDTTGSADPNWNPNADSSIQALKLDGAGNIYVGGGFLTIGGALRNRVAKLSTSGTGAAVPGWDPNVDNLVHAIALEGANVFIGGFYNTVGGTPRSGLARVAASNAALDATWNPAPNGGVEALSGDGAGNLFASGAFASIGGQTRQKLAKLSTSGSGAADASWNPAPNNSVAALLAQTGKVYVGGYFTNIASQAQVGFALLSALSAPGAPTIGTATAGNAQASVTFTAPASDGGSPITSYTVTSSPGGVTATGTASPIVVTGLTNGTAYTFTVKATNVAGTGPSSAASNSVTPATTPGAPTAVTATAGNAQASVSFTAPASNGGSAITGYTVTSSPGGITASGTASPIVVTGLTNGTSYTFTVQAVNGVGPGPASTASNAVIPATVPGAPTSVTAAGGNATATVSFIAPASNGGAAITGYTATSSPGGITGSGTASPIVVSGLTNGTAYTFTVTATNAAGTGPASTPSNSVTPLASSPPGAPIIAGADAGNASATIYFSAPSSSGSSPITSYTATCNPGGFSASGTASPIVVGGLTNGTTYTCSVTATNLAGTSAASSTVSVRPAATVSPPFKVSTESSHALALDATGKVYAWGNDSYGQLGQGRSIARNTPVQVAGLPASTQVSLSGHGLAIDTFKQVWSWGDNSCGQLGPREGAVTSKASRVIGATNMVKVAAGTCYSLAVRADGTVWGWGLVPGYNTGSTGLRQLAGLSGIVDVAAGTAHAVARKSDGTLWTFGDNSQGQLGLGNVGATQAATQVPGVTGVTAIAAGREASLALVAGGQVGFWGKHANGTVVSSPTALPTPGGAAVAIALGVNVPVAARADGAVLEYHAATNTWATEPGFSGIVKTAFRSNLLVGIDGTGQLFALGDNTSGELGLGDNTARTSATAVPGFANTSMVSVSIAFPSVLALKSDGTVWFWGADTLGQSGNGSSISSSVPRLVSIPATVVELATGDRFSLAVDSTGNVWGWGDNSFGALDTTLVSRSTPQLVAGISNVKEVSASGAGLVLYLKNDGTVWKSGTLPGFPGVTAPTQVSGLSGIIGVGTGTSAYAIRSDGVLFAWGQNSSGELGNGTLTASATPVQVSISGSVTHIAAGVNRAAAVTSDGKVWTWGSGILGNGTSGGSATPVQVSTITDASRVSIGLSATIVRRQNGTGLYVWGATGLSDAAAANPLLPFAVTPPVTVKQVKLGMGHNLGFIVTPSGVVAGFGYGNASVTKAVIGDGGYVARGKVALVLARDGGGGLDTNDWYLDLEPSSSETIAASLVPKSLGVSKLFGSESGLSLEATVKYKTGDVGRKFNNYAFALVPADFFGLVKNAPGTPPIAELKRREKAGVVLAQLTPAGWTNVNGQLLAYSQSTANAAGSAVNILNGVNAAAIPGSKFCIGYGESSGSMLTVQSLTEVLSLEGASSSEGGVPCVLTGVYVDGPPTSASGSSVTFRGSVVGLSPTGNVQFVDSGVALQAAQAIALSNEAVATGSISTASLATGVHSIGAIYGGDSQNAAVSAEIPLRHEVVVTPPPATPSVAGTVTSISGASSSDSGSTATFTATVTGSSPTGSVQFKDGSANLGEAVPLVGGLATLRTSSLAPGPHTITANYSGDSGNATSVSSGVSHTVYEAITTAVALSVSPASAVEGSTVTLTATVTATSPTGSVTFRDGGTVIGTATLAGGTASLTLTSLQSGAHAITAEYAGEQSVSSSASFVSISEPGQLTLSASGYDFGGQSMRTTQSTSFILLNTTSSAITVSSVTVSSGAFSVSHGCATVAVNASCTATVSFTPTAEGAASGTLSMVTSGGTFSATLTGTGEKSLVSHYYRSILRRAPDAGGKAFWTAEAARLASLGVNVNETWFAMALQFYTSPEYLAFGRNSTEYVRDLYNTFFNRAADDGGLAYWTGLIAQGLPRDIVLVSFMFSPEFVGFTQAIFGNTQARAEVDTVTDFYRGLLTRLPDSAGFQFWLGQFRTAQCQGAGAVYTQVEAISSAYANSPEYTGRNRTNTQFMGDMYNAFLRRGGDLAGVQYWIGQLDTGARTRDNVRQAFISSPEFSARVQAIISQGCLQ